MLRFMERSLLSVWNPLKFRLPSALNCIPQRDEKGAWRGGGEELIRPGGAAFGVGGPDGNRVRHAVVGLEPPQLGFEPVMDLAVARGNVGQAGSLRGAAA